MFRVMIALAATLTVLAGCTGGGEEQTEEPKAQELTTEVVPTAPTASEMIPAPAEQAQPAAGEAAPAAPPAEGQLDVPAQPAKAE